MPVNRDDVLTQTIQVVCDWCGRATPAGTKQQGGNNRGRAARFTTGPISLDGNEIAGWTLLSIGELTWEGDAPYGTECALCPDCTQTAKGFLHIE